MSRVRIHNFSISLDGFATGEGQALETPFGHAGHRLHEWMIATRFGSEIFGQSGGGAKIATDAALDIRDSFELALVPEHTTRQSCEVVWRRGKTYGVKFLA